MQKFHCRLKIPGKSGNSTRIALERFLSHKRFESIHLLVTYLLQNCCAIPLLNFWIILRGSSSLVTRFNSGKGNHSNIRKQFVLQKEQTKKKTKQSKTKTVIIVIIIIIIIIIIMIIIMTMIMLMMMMLIMIMMPPLRKACFSEQQEL